jgi:predicted DCC family thiol-disulfide oxidoreductase YuxK
MSVDVFKTPPAPRITVWFDGGCVLCRSEIALYRKLDEARGRIAFVDLAGDLESGSCPVDRADLLARFHARDEAGALVSGAAAFGALWRHVTPFQPLGHLMRLGFIERAAEWAYRRFLVVRPRLQAWLARRRVAGS